MFRMLTTRSCKSFSAKLLLHQSVLLQVVSTFCICPYCISQGCWWPILPVCSGFSEKPNLQLQHQTGGCPVSSSRILIRMLKKIGQNSEWPYLEIRIQVEFKSLNIFFWAQWSCQFFIHLVEWTHPVKTFQHRYEDSVGDPVKKLAKTKVENVHWYLHIQGSHNFIMECNWTGQVQSILVKYLLSIPKHLILNVSRNHFWRNSLKDFSCN